MAPTHTGLSGTDCIGQDKGLAPGILGARQGVAVTKASELSGVQRTAVAAALDHPFATRPPWHFDGPSAPLGVSRRSSPQPGGELRHAAPRMVDHACTHHGTLAVEHTALRRL